MKTTIYPVIVQFTKDANIVLAEEVRKRHTIRSLAKPRAVRDSAVRVLAGDRKQAGERRERGIGRKEGSYAS